MDREPASQANFTEIAEVILRRINLFIIPAILISIITVVIGSMLPKTYETSALIEIKTKSIVGSVAKDQPASTNVDNDFATLVKQITSWSYLEQLVAQLHLADKISSPADREMFIKIFKDKIKFTLKNGNIVEISYQDRDPFKAQQIVNTLTGSLIEKNDSLQKEEAKHAIDFIQQQLVIYKQKLDSSQKNVSNSKIGDNLRAAMEKKLLLLEKIQNMQRIVPSQITNAENSAVAQMQARLGQLEMDLAKISYDAKEDNPRVLELKKEIQDIKEKINSEMDKSNVKENVFMLNPLYVQAKQELKQTELELDSLNQRKQEMEGRDKPDSANLSEEELTNIERNKMVDEDIYKLLLKQLESAYVSERLENSENGNRYSVLEYARLPLRPVKPKMAMVGFMGLALGILSGFGLVFAVENISGAFQTKEQVQDMLAIPFLSSISKMVLEENSVKKGFAVRVKEKINAFIQTNKMLSGLSFVTPHVAKKLRDKDISAQLVVFHEPNCVLSDELRILRTHIFHGTGEETPPHTLILTSTLRGEGKSTTSANLAVTIADSGRKTLLMDCDLRKGTIGSIFSLPSSKGLIDVLTGEAEIDSAIVNTKIKNLSILHAGGGNRKPSELLDSPAMVALMKKLKERYEYIIIDSPPIINLPDASVMSRLADAVIIVIQAGRAKKKDVLLAKEKLIQVDTKIAGFVLTNVQYYMPKYLYDYYYSYDYH